MIGPDALVTDWRAEQLEISLYTALMRSYDGSMDSNDVAWCYGLNACGQLLADSPKRSSPTSTATTSRSVSTARWFHRV
jgi:hypothetical protein